EDLAGPDTLILNLDVGRLIHGIRAGQRKEGLRDRHLGRGRRGHGRNWPGGRRQLLSFLADKALPIAAGPVSRPRLLFLEFLKPSVAQKRTGKRQPGVCLLSESGGFLCSAAKQTESACNPTSFGQTGPRLPLPSRGRRGGSRTEAKLRYA